MNRISIVFTIIFACSNSAYGMSNEEYEKSYFEKPIWSGVTLLVRDACTKQVLDTYLHRLLCLKTDLHAPDEFHHYLLGELLLEAASDSWYNQQGSLRAALKKCCDNCAYVLKELIKSKKVDPEVSGHGRAVCDILDQQFAFNSYPGRYFTQLQQICTQAAQERASSNF